MIKAVLSYISPTFAKIGFFTIFIFLTGMQITAAAQCSSQAPNDSPATAFAVPPNTTVYYAFDPSMQNVPPGAGSTPTSQVQAAFSGWSNANTSSGGTGTKFALADATHSATVTITADQNTGNAAATESANTGIISSANPATITFHPQSFIGGTSYNLFQVTQPGYDSAYLEVALHEIGHLMGIDDYPAGSAPPPGPDSSVMIPADGINDNQNNFQKTGPTSCDAAQAATATNAIDQEYAVPQGGGSPPSMDMGGGGGGWYGCQDYWDSSTNTLYGC